MNLDQARRGAARLPGPLGAFGRLALDQLDPGRRRRRTWSTTGRAHLEVRGLDLPGRDLLVKDLEAALCRIGGVSWAEVNVLVGRVVVGYEPKDATLDDLLEVVEAVETRHGAGGQRFPKGRPEHPADIEGLRRAAVALGADVVGVGISGFGQLLRITPFPVELASVVSLADQQPRVRDLLERLVGTPGTDYGLGLASAFAQAIAQGPFGLVVDIGYRVQQVSESHARRAAWERLEPKLCSTPGGTAPAGRRERRPVRLRPGQVERYADRTALVSLGAAGAVLALTGSPRRSAGLLVAGLPKASRLGPETFAAVLGEKLARRDVLVMDRAGLRCLDRVDLAVLDARVLLGPPTLGIPAAVGVSGQELQAVLAELFDPMRPHSVARQGEWVVGPLARLARLDFSLPATAAARRRARSGATGVLGVARGSSIVAVVELNRTIDPLGVSLAETVKGAGLELVIAGGPGWLAKRLGPRRSIAGGPRLARSIRALQADGAGVLLVSTGDAHQALLEADCSVGLTGCDGTVPWGADFIAAGGLVDAHLVVEATAAARRVSARGAQLAVAGSSAGALSSVLGLAGTAGRRAALAVNGAALVAEVHAVVAARTLTGQPRPQTDGMQPWHEMECQDVLAALGTGPHGLRPEQASERRLIPDRPPPTVLRLARAVGDELANPLTPVLGAGAILAAAVGSVTDAGLVAGVVGMNALIGGVQRVRAQVSIGRLIEVSNGVVTVRRFHGARAVGRDELVPGDVVELMAGQVVPADCRILEADACEVDESVLTGESFPVLKDSAVTPGAGVADRTSMLFEGTTISSGRTVAVAVAVGPGTEIGRSLANASPPPPSGVETRLDSLTTLTVPITLASGAAVSGMSLLRGRSPRQAIASGVSLMAAAVPEGLPLLASVAQQAAAHRLSTRGALVRHPRTIEALGRVDTLCFDKTGTLTAGKIRLQQVSDGSEDQAPEALGSRSRRVLAAALRASPECNGGPVDHLPHATDRSVVTAAAAVGVTTAEGLGGWHPLDHLAFDSARAYHAVVGFSPSGARVAVKGAPEVILPRCTSWCSPEGSRCLTQPLGRQLEQVVERMTRRGLRVLAVAERPSSGQADLVDDRVANLELLGFLGLADPIRPSAAAAITDLRAAGVNVVMITGDHPNTARAIGEELGLVNGHRLIAGGELDRMSDDELEAMIPQVSVFARVTPAHKVRIVRAYQRIGRVVAMTGDGANDAPAIRLAHAGVALGARGSPAAREAADVVVVDDRIETILAAIVEGRALWTSVRDALAILIGGNLGEVAFTVAATSVAGASPLAARQFLLVNLLTDMLPAMTIALRPPTKASPASLLHEGPEASLGPSLVRQITLRAASTAGGALGAWTVAKATGTNRRASTVALVALVGSQLGQTAVVGGRSPLVLASTAASGAALVGIVQTPGISHFFGCRPLGPIGWSIAIGASTLATGSSVVASRVGNRHAPGAATNQEDPRAGTPRSGS